MKTWKQGLIGIIALVAVIGFSMAGCNRGGSSGGGGDSGGSSAQASGDAGGSSAEGLVLLGTITITGIPSEYNGKYARFNSSYPGGSVSGHASVSGTMGESSYRVTSGQITNGRVSLGTYWYGINQTGNLTSTNNFLYIYETETDTNWRYRLATRTFSTVTYVNGSVTLAWSQSTEAD